MTPNIYYTHEGLGQGNPLLIQKKNSLINIIISNDSGTAFKTSLESNGVENCIHYTSINSFVSDINRQRDVSFSVSSITIHTQHIQEAYKDVQLLEECIGKKSYILLIDNIHDDIFSHKHPAVQSIICTKDYKLYHHQLVELSSHLASSELNTIQLKKKPHENSRINGNERHKELRNNNDTSVYNTIVHSLENNQFNLYYQPIINLKNNDITHYEVLLRMQHQITNTEISPAVFIPIAEQYNIIDKIDRWVIKNVFKQISKFYKKNIKYQINLSAQYFNNVGAAVYIENLLIQNSLNADNIIFEITETSKIIDFNRTISEINKIKSTGVQIALDDFGTGYNSFSQLQKLPIDIIKIDGSYIKDLENNKFNQEFITAIVALAHATNKKVVAECIENKATLDIIRSLNIDYAQGYYIGYPEPLENV